MNEVINNAKILILQGEMVVSGTGVYVYKIHENFDLTIFLLQLEERVGKVPSFSINFSAFKLYEFFLSLKYFVFGAGPSLTYWFRLVITLHKKWSYFERNYDDLFRFTEKTLTGKFHFCCCPTY